MIKVINDHSSIGNSLMEINNNFQFLNIRACLVDDNAQKLNDLFTNFVAISSNIADFSTFTANFSASLRDMGTLVHNISGFWTEPLDIVYEKTFSTIANYVEIETWLNTTFGSKTFAPTQILKISYSLKNYDPTALNGTSFAGGTTTDALNTLASNYQQNFRDIQNYLSYTNSINAIISSINSILNINNMKDLIITDRSQLSRYYSDMTVRGDTIQSKILNGLSQNYMLPIFVYLEQYELFKSRYEYFINLGIPQLPQNVLTFLNIQNIETILLGSMCFKLNSSNKWKFTPNCALNFCVTQICDDCYDYLDPNSLYSDRCPYQLSYVITLCDGTEYISGDSQFYPYIGKNINITINGTDYIAKVKKIDSYSIEYPLSKVLLVHNFKINGLSVPCPGFKMTINSGMNGLFHLPLSAAAPFGSYNFTVDWGDNTAINSISASDDPLVEHTFPSSFTDYQLTINGALPAFDSSFPSLCEINIKSIDSWGQLKLETMKHAFVGCDNLLSIASGGDFSRVTDFHEAFYGCTSLQSFPVLKNTSNVKDFSYAWYNCENMKTFGLINTSGGNNFAAAWTNCRSLSTFPLLNVGNSLTFYTSWNGCSSLGEIPALNFGNSTYNIGAFNLCRSLTASKVINTKSDIDYIACNLDASHINTIFSNLSSVGTPYQSIWIADNPGAATCDTSIALAKHWWAYV